MRLHDLLPGDKVYYRPNPQHIYTVIEVVPSKKGTLGYALIKNVHAHEVRAVGGQMWRVVQMQAHDYTGTSSRCEYNWPDGDEPSEPCGLPREHHYR